MKKVFFLGPKNSYSSIISHKILNKNEHNFVACKNFQEIIENTNRQQNSFGVLPIENSITSDIHENIDALFQNDFAIYLEAFLQIRLHLIGLQNASLTDITNVFSHVRALSQCSKYIKKHAFVPHETTSTSEGLKKILDEKNRMNAVIGSKNLAQDKNVKILKEDIGDEKYNITRFVFITNDKQDIQANKTTIIFKVAHTPGSLAAILTKFAILKLNLTKIESRPIPGTNWEYYFWADLENQNGNLDMQSIIQMLKENTKMYKIVGVYKKGLLYKS